MATPAEQAALYNEAIAQGLTQQEAINFAGIQDFDNFVFVDGLLSQRSGVENFAPQPVDDFAQEQANLEAAAAAEAQAFARGDIPPPAPAADPQAYPNGLPVDERGNLNPGWELNEQTGEYIYVGNLTPGQVYVSPGTAASAAASRKEATLAQARNQATLSAQQGQADQGDWRVKLRLAPGATYLYEAPAPGILAPLSTRSGTGGVVFPYTPRIDFSYNARYQSYDLTHSNYRGYFYSGSHVEAVTLTADFTAQDSAEAAYLLAVIHFFRSVTKMFYGQDDAFAGAPPPLVYLQGLGQYQFALHPCVVSQFNYNLPSDVDYIRANSPTINGTNLVAKRTRGPGVPTDPFTSAWSRIQNVLKPQNVNKGAVPLGGVTQVPTFGTDRPTYVPTKIAITLTLLPMQNRQQVSRQFSLKGYANGNLLRGPSDQPGAFW